MSVHEPLDPGLETIPAGPAMPQRLRAVQTNAAKLKLVLPPFIMDAAPASLPVPYFDGLDYGIGVDTPSATALNVAVTGDPSEIPHAGGAIVDYYMNELTSEEDLQTALGVSAEANGGIGLFKASARLDYAKSCNMNSSSVFLIVRVQVTNAFTMIKQPGISQAAATLLANGDVAAFQRQYGDMFVRGLQTGGSFFGVIQIQTSSETDKQSISAKVSAAYGAFGASGSFSDDFKQAVSNRSVLVTCHVEGGVIPQPLPTTIDGLIGAVNPWPGTVADPTLNKAVPYTALLDGYGVLPLPNPPNFIDLQHQQDVLNQCSLLRNQDELTFNDIAYIKQNPSQFVNPNAAQLDQWQNKISQDLNTIAAAASNALNNPAQAQLPVLQLPPPVQLPQRVTASAVTGLSPASGAAGGGDTVTVTGTGFTGATRVSFGSVAATNLAVASDTQLTVTSPAPIASGAAVDVTVTTPAGTSATSPADKFTYAAPPPKVLTTSLPEATCGFAYNAQLEASGGAGTLSWALQSGSLPIGLSLNPAGVISGTPAPDQGEPVDMTFAVTDSAGRQSFSPAMQIYLKGRRVFWEAPMIDQNSSQKPHPVDITKTYTITPPVPGAAIDLSTIHVDAQSMTDGEAKIVSRQDTPEAVILTIYTQAAGGFPIGHHSGELQVKVSFTYVTG
jgi:hypothetical protein